MKKTLALLIFGCTMGTGAAFATPMTPIAGDSDIEQVRMVCNEYGRCTERDDNPGEAIARGVMRGIEGRGGDRDYDRGYERRDREYRRDRRRERDEDD